MKVQKPTLKRELGLFELILSGIGTILGAGIYVLLGKAAGLAGDAVWLSFLFASVVAALTGISYMELTSMYPKASAEYIYVKKAFGSRSAFVIGLLVILGLIIANSTVALGFAGYFSVLFNTPIIPTAIVLIMIFSLVLFIGVKQSVQIVVFMTIIEVGGLLLTIFIGLPYIGSVNYFEIRNISGIFEASTLVFFAFLGFEDIVKLSQETRFPERNIPKALILSIMITVVLYILVAISAVSILGYEALSTSSAPLADVASVALGSDVFLVMSMVALFSTANTSLLMMLGGSRILYGIAESGSLPHVFSRIHPKRQTPWAAILAITLFSILFLFIGDITVVANISNFMIFIIFFVVNISLIRLRYREPDVKRPFKSPINIGRFAVLPALGAISTVFLFSHLSIEVMIYGSILLIAGVIISLFSNHNT